jgi:hypothetical protein
MIKWNCRFVGRWHVFSRSWLVLWKNESSFHSTALNSMHPELSWLFLHLRGSHSPTDTKICSKWITELKVRTKTRILCVCVCVCVVLGLELRAFTLSHSASPFCDGHFQDRVSQTICPGWLWTTILSISVSWVARITGVSHRCLA